MMAQNPVARLIYCTSPFIVIDFIKVCLLYTSDAADERSSVDLGGRRIIKKNKNTYVWNMDCKYEYKCIT